MFVGWGCGDGDVGGREMEGGAKGEEEHTQHQLSYPTVSSLMVAIRYLKWQ